MENKVPTLRQIRYVGHRYRLPWPFNYALVRLLLNLTLGDFSRSQGAGSRTTSTDNPPSLPNSISFLLSLNLVKGGANKDKAEADSVNSEGKETCQILNITF